MKRDGGYLIVEMIGAIFVLSVAASIVCSVLISSAVKVREFDRAVTARIIAANELARLKHNVRSGLHTTVGEKNRVASPMADRLRDFDGWAKVDSFRDGLRQIEVNVTWRERGGTRSVRLCSLVGER